MNAKGWFPTLICDFDSKNHDQFKTIFYNDLEKYVHPEGIEGEHANLAFHHNTEFTFLFKEITDFAKQYLETLELNSEDWDLHLVKCWWQSLGNHHIPLHNHSDAHLSFVYYVNVPPESGHLHFQTDQKTFINDLTNGMFMDDYEQVLPFRQYNYFNSQSVAYEPKEGMVVIFPGKLDHMTTMKPGEDAKTTDVDVIKKRRISIAGDFIITFKKPKHTAMGLQPVSNWRKFE